MTNAEVYGALALILIELQKINERLDEVINDCEADALDLKHLPDLMCREDKSISL